mgnify:CR=1 FL=1
MSQIKIIFFSSGCSFFIVSMVSFTKRGWISLVVLYPFISSSVRAICSIVSRSLFSKYSIFIGTSSCEWQMMEGTFFHSLSKRGRQSNQAGSPMQTTTLGGVGYLLRNISSFSFTSVVSFIAGIDNSSPSTVICSWVKVLLIAS